MEVLIFVASSLFLPFRILLCGIKWINSCYVMKINFDIYFWYPRVPASVPHMKRAIFFIIYNMSASPTSPCLLWWPPTESHYNIYYHSALGCVSHAHCIVLLYSDGNKITTSTNVSGSICKFIQPRVFSVTILPPHECTFEYKSQHISNCAYNILRNISFHVNVELKCILINYLIYTTRALTH